jgi:uncharacterized protein
MLYLLCWSGGRSVLHSLFKRSKRGLRALMRRYQNRPMSLADACLVRLSEIHNSAELLTLDSDFRIYRRHGNKVIPVRMPD